MVALSSSPAGAAAFAAPRSRRPSDISRRNSPERRAEFGGPAETVAVPERQPARLSVGGADQHPVERDLLDPPAGGAEREDVADPRFVDHLLVEFADPGGLLADHVDGEQAAVGDGAARGDGQALRAGPAGERVGVAVPHQPRAQLGELVGRVAAREQVERGLVRRARQGREATGAADRVEPVVDVERFERAGGDRLLGEDVERVGGDARAPRSCPRSSARR